VAALKNAQVCAVSHSQAKLERALAWGATAAICASQPDWVDQVREWAGGIGADIVVDSTGSPRGFRMASDIVRPRGTIALKTTCGLPTTGIDFTKLVVDEVKIQASRCGPFPKAIRLLSKHHLPIKSLIAEIYPLDRVTQAIEGAPTMTKVLIQPNA
ncbi:zinc-binding dehydrogenase, partial [Candidatus Poribacteria bacterium]|nr:zinc-binding dehydrogenase [Candidatus Poribacteria bacterium]